MNAFVTDMLRTVNAGVDGKFHDILSEHTKMAYKEYWKKS